MLDIVFAVSSIIILSPVLLISALAVVLTSRGPVLFKQERVGCKLERNGELVAWRIKPFKMYKFRSMYTNQGDGDHRKLAEAYVTGDVEKLAGIDTAPGMFKLGADPRITPVGAFIRRYSIDELPQLLNVIKGDMSIVGPRPPLQYEVDNYMPWHMARFRATPGITGLWQVMGRTELTFEEMVRLDVEYSREQSFLLDLKIVLRTFSVVLKGKGAA